MEESLLGLHLVLQELDVVHQEHVVLAVALLELEGRVVSHQVDEVVGELLAGNVADAHARVLILDVVTHGAQEVRLSQPDAPVDEERVVDEARCLRHRERRRVGEPVAGPDDEGVERVLGFERPWRPRVQHRLRTFGGGAVAAARPAPSSSDAHDQRSVRPSTGSRASSSGRKRLSMYSLANVLGTEISSRSSWIYRPYPFEPDPQ